jgi:hypothetical protein
LPSDTPVRTRNRDVVSIDDDDDEAKSVPDGKYERDNQGDEYDRHATETSSDSDALSYRQLMQVVFDLQSQLKDVDADRKDLKAQLVAVHEAERQRRAASSDRRAQAIAAVTTSPTQSSTSTSSSSSTMSTDKVNDAVRKAVNNMKEWEPSNLAEAERLDSWLRRYALNVTNAGGSESHMLTFIGGRLKGLASDWYFEEWLPKQQVAQASLSWSDFKKAIISRFQPRQSTVVITAQLRECQKKHDESYQAHLERFQKILHHAVKDTIPKVTIMEAYLESLSPDVRFEIETRHDAELYSVAADQSPSEAQICQWAIECDRALQTFHRANSMRRSTGRHFTGGGAAQDVSTQTASMTSSTTASSTSTTPRLPGVSPNYKGKFPDPNYQPRQGGANSQAGGAGSKSTPPTPPTQAALPTAIIPNSVAPAASGGLNSARVCYNCGQPGHFRGNCPQAATRNQQKKDGQK